MNGRSLRLVRFLCLGLMAVAFCGSVHGLPDPVTEWTIELGNVWGATPTPYPSAAPNSVIVATGGRVTRVDGAGKVTLRVEFGPEEGRGGEIMPPPAELDGDPDEELILTHKVGIVYGFDVTTSTTLWETNLGDSFAQYEFVVAGDVDGDGLDEAVATALSGWVTCLDSDGKVLWRTRVHTVEKSISSELSTPAIGDINNDGQAEIVFGTATQHLIALDSEGRVLWDSFLPPHQMNRTPVLIADLNRDGRAEVFSMSSMLSPGRGLVCVDGTDGELLWTGLKLSKAYLGRKVIPFADGSLGVIACDKGGNIHAHRADGSLAWHTRLSGRGVYWPPAVADVDGDGRQEIVATIRETSLDGKGNNWYVLDADSGKPLGGYPNKENGYPSPATCDIDGDGVLEVLINSSGGHLTAYSFGGPAPKEPVNGGAWYEPPYRATVAQAPTRDTAPPEVALLPDEPLLLRFGNNPIEVRLPRPAGLRQSVELECLQPDGVRRVEVRPAKEGADTVVLTLPVSQAGKYALAVRVLDMKTGSAIDIQDRTVQVLDVLEPIAAARTSAVAELDDARAHFVAEGLEVATRMGQLAGEVSAAFDVLSARVASVSRLNTAELSRLLADADDYMTLLERSRDLRALTRAEAEAGRIPSFAMWQDENPWDNVDPLDELPPAGELLPVSVWAFGDEWEFLCFNIVNLAPIPLSLRIEPGKIEMVPKAEGAPLPKISEAARFFTTVPLPTAGGEEVPDMLPRLGDGQILNVAPGQVRQLWLNVSTHGLPAGQYQLTWPVRTLDARADTRTLAVSLDVSPARCPAKSRFLACYWTGWGAASPLTIPDMNEHLVTIWQGIPLPAAKADDKGQIVGEIDWSTHDAFVKQIKQPEILFYGNSEVPAPEFPEGVTVSDELKLTGQRAYAKRLVAHLAELGFGYKDFMFYPEDEPGLKGEITTYLEHARRNKLIDPNIQNYANPWECTIDMLREMWDVTDVWQPGMEVLQYLGPEAVEVMHRGGKRIATYTPPGGPRTLRPLGFYRSQSWLALHWGIEGGGWYAYQVSDLFTASEPGYGGVHVDELGYVTSRRWEAMRDGIEDFNIVSDLRDLAKQKEDHETLATIDAAVAYVADHVLTGATREAAEYDFSYADFMTHRARIRQEYERLIAK